MGPHSGARCRQDAPVPAEVGKSHPDPVAGPNTKRNAQSVRDRREHRSVTVANPVPADTDDAGAGASVVDIRDRGRPAPPSGEFSGPEAAELAGISYRQLDYWARQQWVVPSKVSAAGTQRRVYSASDIVRLAALGHLGRSRVDVATYGRSVGKLPVPDSPAFLIVWGIHDERVQLASAKDLRRMTSRPGRYVIFDPAPLLRDMQRRRADGRGQRPLRRTFTSEYKLAVLAEYERLDEPGAKSMLLRREGLHTSHLVAWRRWRRASATSALGASRRSAGALQ